MKCKKRLSLFCFMILQVILFNTVLTSCGFININSTKYYKELKASYSYDFETQVLKKFASEILVDEENEFLSFDGKSVKPFEYKTVKVTLPHEIDIEISITYAIHNGELIVAEVPEMQVPYEYFTLGDSTDTLIIALKNAPYLVNLSDLSATPMYSSPLDMMEENFDWRIISVSPDGKYFLSAYASELFAYDIESKTETKIMDYVNTEFLFWEKDKPGNFLYRKKKVAYDGIEIYSDIYRYSLPSGSYSDSQRDIFLVMDGKYTQFEMIDDEYIYAYSYKSTKDYMHGVLYIRNMYADEIKAVVLPRYAHVWDISLSDSKEYAALCALYIDEGGNQVSRLITVNLDTNDIRFYYELGYETGLENYGMHSFYWCPGNILIVNFLNIRDLYNDLCRFHRINHTKSNIPKVDIEDILYKDSINYEEEE